jgi:glycosyltransferase involved in cell wall biosynthesis
LLVYVGRISEEKNIWELLAQFALAREMVPELHLLLVGDGPRRERVPERARTLGVGEAVHCPGAVPFEDVGSALALAEGFVTASTSEVHPLTVIEAMAAGLPVVAVSSPGIRDTVEHGRTGILTSKGTGLAAAMVSLLSDQARREQLGEAARAASEQYDIHHTVGRTLELYQQLRETRPDLQRKRKHGRWRMPSPPPLLEQLGRMLRPPE